MKSVIISAFEISSIFAFLETTTEDRKYSSLLNLWCSFKKELPVGKVEGKFERVYDFM